MPEEKNGHELVEEQTEYSKRRTHLSNERTLLSYWRTGLSFFVLGAFLVRFFDNIGWMIAGATSLVFGAVLFFYGIYRFARRRKKIKRM
jgi:putative membrane protein